MGQPVLGAVLNRSEFRQFGGLFHQPRPAAVVNDPGALAQQDHRIGPALHRRPPRCLRECVIIDARQVLKDFAGAMSMSMRWAKCVRVFMAGSPILWHMAKKRKYERRIVGGQVMMPADLERTHKFLLELERVDAISDEMREVVEELWPELVHKLPKDL
jgi:hypothetical protein